MCIEVLIEIGARDNKGTEEYNYDARNINVQALSVNAEELADGTK